MQTPTISLDVAIIGGSISGSATALMLLREQPQLKVCIIERDAVLKRRVGESTVEMSSYFLNERLGLGRYLNEQHLIKQGLRFWFYQQSDADWTSCSEIGPEYHVRLPGFQVDRSTLDEHVLKLAVGTGAQLLREHKVVAVELEPGGIQQLSLEGPDGPTTLKCRWVVDAGGSQCMLARKLGTYHRNDRHPIASIWSRWKGVESLDAPRLRQQCNGFASRCKGTRYTATNHFVGDGWWAWCIPLKGGDVSIGIVYDERRVDLSGASGLKNKLRGVLEQHPVARELIANADLSEEDLHHRRKLPYFSDTLFGDGFCMVGDAAGFIDPFYSPGLDWVAYTTCSAVDLITNERAGNSVEDRIAMQNERFRTSYQRWFEAIYENKYFYMGDFELMDLAFRLDLGTYYLGIVSQPYKIGHRAFTIPSFAGRYATPAFRIIRAYNRRLTAIARGRMRRGTWGRHNHGHFHRFQSYELNKRLPRRVLAALLTWLKLELTEGWRTWFTRENDPAAQSQYLRQPLQSISSGAGIPR